MTMFGATITDSHDHGNLTVTQVIQKSSNVGAARLAMMFTPREMWELYSRSASARSRSSAFPAPSPGACARTRAGGRSSRRR